MPVDPPALFAEQEATISRTGILAGLQEGKTLDEIFVTFDPAAVAADLRARVLGNRSRSFLTPSDRRLLWESTIRWCAQELGLIPPDA